MCMFVKPVVSVSSTQLFARMDQDGSQFLVYEMNYKPAEPNAMILPLPIRRPALDSSLKFIDLRNYETFFENLDKGFPYLAPRFNIGCSGAPESASDHLEVVRVGNYIASFVPTLADFSRLDPRFALPDSTWKKVPQYANFGFAVFQLAAGSLRPHPMAFVFESDRSSIFFPTVHIHDGDVHALEEFDHVLYLQHAGFDSRVYGYRNSFIPDRSTDLVRSRHTADRFMNLDRSRGIVQGDLLVHRKILRGEFDNKDTEFATSGHPTIPRWNLRPWLAYSPWAVMIALVSWFLMRRQRIKRAGTRQLPRDSRTDETNG